MKAKDIEQYCCEVYGFDCAIDRGQGFVDGATWADKISFKAGRASRKEEIEELMDYAFKDGERIGTRKVVEWIEEKSHSPFSEVADQRSTRFISDGEWQAKLENWGIKEDK